MHVLGHANPERAPSRPRRPRRALVARAALVLVLAGAALMVDSTTVRPRADAALPPLSGSTFGFELCPQSLCGAATVVGYFGGDADGRRAAGWWVISALHDALPASGARAAVTGGRWSLSIRGQHTAGVVLGGALRNNGDDTFDVTIRLASGGATTPMLTFSGTLSHRAFPPTVVGTLSGG